MHGRLLGTKSLLTLYQIINKPDFPFLEDEIAEPRQYMNIKVAACIHVTCLINILQCPLLTLVMPNSFMIYNPLKFLFCKAAS